VDNLVRLLIKQPNRVFLAKKVKKKQYHTDKSENVTTNPYMPGQTCKNSVKTMSCLYFGAAACPVLCDRHNGERMVDIMISSHVKFTKPLKSVALERVSVVNCKISLVIYYYFS